MKGKDKIKAVLGIVIVIVLVLYGLKLNNDKKSDSFSDVLHAWGNAQEEYSDELTENAVSGVEGGAIVGNHIENGANWSIPNIIRNILGIGG